MKNISKKGKWRCCTMINNEGQSNKNHTKVGNKSQYKNNTMDQLSPKMAISLQIGWSIWWNIIKLKNHFIKDLRFSWSRSARIFLLVMIHWSITKLQTRNKLLCAAIYMVSTTIYWTSSSLMETHHSEINISSTAILLTEVHSQSNVSWPSSPGNVLTNNSYTWPEATMRQNKSIWSTGSREKSKPNSRIWVCIRLFLNYFVACLSLMCSIGVWWFAMVDCPALMVWRWRKSKKLIGLSSHLREAWCAICYGLTLWTAWVENQASEESQWVLAMTFPTNSSIKTN